MYSSCALRSASPAASRQFDDAERDEHFGGLDAHDARLIDEPRQDRRQRAFAIADRAERVDAPTRGPPARDRPRRRSANSRSRA